MTKVFSIYRILSVLTHRLLPPDQGDHQASTDDLSDHLLQDVRGEVGRIPDGEGIAIRRALISQFPALSDLDDSEVNPDNGEWWVDQWAEKLGGRFLEVKSIPSTSST